MANWDWLKEHMPGVVRQMKEYREAGEGEHLDECWRRGVQRGEPNWFYAVEGPIALGTAFEPHANALACRHLRYFRGREAVLLMAPLPTKSQTMGTLNGQD